MHMLTHELDYYHLRADAAEFAKEFLTARRLIEYQLFEVQSDISSDGIQQCYCLAAQIYINRTFRTFNRGTRTLSSLAKSLRTAMEAIQSTQGNSLEPLLEVFLWMAFVGGAVSEGVMRLWYLSLVHFLTDKLALCTWEDIEAVLVRRLFPPGLLSDDCKTFWMESGEMVDLGLTLYSNSNFVSQIDMS